MRIFNRKSSKSISMQQHTDAISGLVPVICRYPHRKNKKGDTPTKVVFVKSTALPEFRFHNFFAWQLHLMVQNGSASNVMIILRKGGLK